MLLSIIIPMFNAENTIESCLESVIVHDKFKNFDIILIDDGSTDETENRVKKYLNYENIRYYYQENRGVSAARNRGILNAKTKYLFFLDADDYIEGDLLNSLYKLIIENKLDLAAANFKEINSTKYNYSDKESPAFIIDGNDISNYLDEIHFKSACGKLFCTQIIRDNKLFFCEELRHGEDMNFVLEYLFFCEKLGLTDVGKYCVRNINTESLSKQFVSDMPNSIMIQYRTWKNLSKKFVFLDENYSKNHIGFSTYLLIVLINNLFKLNNNMNFRTKVKKIKHYIKNYYYLFSHNDNLSSINLYEKICYFLLKYRLVYCITFFFMLKEFIKRNKIL